MPDQKLSQLTAATTPLTGAELVYVVQGGNQRRTTAADVAGLVAATDLSYDAATRTLSSSTGADVVLPEATTTLAGLMAAASLVKLNSIIVDRAQLTVAEVRNNSGVAIPKGAPVYVTGSSGIVKTVALADASTEATAANTIGVALDVISHNSNGFIVTEGLLSGVDTSTLTEGQMTWLSETTGAITTTRPTQPAHGVHLGWCVKQAAGSAGILYIKVDNGYELDELHDVLIVGATTGQVLRRAADGLWKNATLTAGDVGADAAGTATASMSAHTGAANPHSQYALSSGLGNSATRNVGTTAGTVAAGDDARFHAAVTLAASVADVLNLSGQELQADDPGGDRLLFWDDSEGKLTHLTLGTNLSITGTTINAAGSGGGAGTKTLVRFTPRDNQPPAASFATLDTRNSVSVLEFDAATQESALFVSIIPEAAVLTDGLMVRIWWMGDTATSGNVRWAASFERSGTNLNSDSFDADTEVTSAANGTSGIETLAEITCTAIDNLAAGERFRLKISRKATDATNDTMTGDAQVVAVEVRGVA